MLREYDDIKEETKDLKASTVHQRFKFIYKIMFSLCYLKWRKKRKIESKNPKVEKTSKNE